MSTLMDKNSSLQPGMGKSLRVVAVVTAAILMIPLVAMQFTNEVVWTPLDFVAAGTLLAIAGVAVSLALRKLRGTQGRLVALGLIGLLFLYCWAELAVGIFTNLGS